MKYLTKSKYKVALECPTKLYYHENSDSYENLKIDDPFLEALAKGGFQVGELAKCYYPEGQEVKELAHDIAIEKTKQYLEKENVVVFEAAIKFQNCFIRVDILEKKGRKINLIEVKSKSAHPDTFEDELWNKKKIAKGERHLKSDWKTYVYDVAFQAYVLKKVFPDYEINSYLMCADKSKVATIDGLNQKFTLIEENGRTRSEPRGDVSLKALGKQILSKFDLNEVVGLIHSEKEMSERFAGKGFEGAIQWFSDALTNNERLPSEVGSHCKSCEFRTVNKSGFKECWKQAKGLNEEELSSSFVFDVWNFRGSQKAIDSGKTLLEDLDASDFKTGGSDDGLSNGDRQLLQVEKEKDKDKSPYIDLEGLALEFGKFTFPLHMIDFETCMAAIPFTKGMRPYEQIAFQFSHHMIHEDGKIEHANEFISSEPGVFPNFEFVRQLKKAIGTTGTIFRYSNHENTVLCQIREQLLESEEKDKDDLVSFIEEITIKKTKQKKIIWEGPRNMVDLCELVKGYYYSPLTKGSNSLKYVLPAILAESEFIQEKYSKPTYGTDVITSKNFKNHTWIEKGSDGEIQNPYKTLPPVFDRWDFEELELVMSDEDIQNGGAALTAYSMMQFTHMSDIERQKVVKALLRYCELDTFAMVLIWEHWNDLIEKEKEAAA